jgi:NAD(P)-dependent dehydrogenase (short-subunit alcohol dehydrogenase family)
MKIIIIGANGTVGRKIVEALGTEHEIVKVGRNSGDIHADITDPKSLKAMYQKVGKFDAVVNASGDIAFAPLKELNTDHWEKGFNSKLMGQVNVVTIGKDFINEGGSFTLTSGVLTDAFIAYGVSGSAINSAIDGFARAAACEIGRGIRINVVSPGILEESMKAFGNFFPGHLPVPGAKVAQYYKRSVLGIETGQVFKALP